MTDRHEHHRIHQLTLLIEEIVSPFRAYAAERELLMLDFAKLDTSLGEIKTEVANIETNQAAAVAKAVADTEAANQAQLDAKVASDVTPVAVGFPEPAVDPEPAAGEPVTDPQSEPDPNAPDPAAE